MKLHNEMYNCLITVEYETLVSDEGKGGFGREKVRTYEYLYVQCTP